MKPKFPFYLSQHGDKWRATISNPQDIPGLKPGKAADSGYCATVQEALTEVCVKYLAALARQDSIAP
jgi:hypothetical protein